jgi:lipid-A-disaccharide synthase-like uncharacterized protein
MEFGFWIILGILAQIMFFLRFFIQWIVSEKNGKSTIPIAFWYLSIIGGAGLLVYSIHIKDPIFIFGQSMGILIYVRNLIMIYNKNDKKPK